MTRLAAIALVCVFSACQSANALRPAVLVDGDAATMARVEAALASALGVANVEIGASDLTRSPAIPVLPVPPSPREGHSMAQPVLFDLALRGGACVAVRRTSGDEVALPGVACRPLQDEAVSPR